ncbi:MAG: OmpH family outer membrane protein [Desulfuromonadales bacterium]|nr:OmpH family outer membrane protein [Desulfuromonadales bacterium]
MKQLVKIYMLALLLALATSALAADGVKYASLDVQKILMAADEVKIASVDVQKILNLSDAGKEAKRQLEMDVLKAEIEKNSREKELNKLKTELEKHGSSLSETERSAKEKVYENRLQEYQQFIQKTTEEIRSENSELTSRIVGDIIKVVRDYGRKKGFLFIFFKSDSVLYLDDKVDVTNAIMQALNEK